MAGWGGGGSGSTKTKAPTKLSPNIAKLITSGKTSQAKQAVKAAGYSDKQATAILKVIGSQNKGILNRFSNEVKGTVTGIPRGLFGLGKAAGEELAVNPIKHLAQGKVSATDIPVAGLAVGLAKGAAKGEPVPEAPLSSIFGASFRHTGSRLTHPRELVRDYSQHPFNAPLEDLANISIAAAPIAKALGLAGFARSAEVVGNVGEKAGAVANVPFLPVSGTARLANKALGRAGEAISTSERFRPVLEHLKLTPEARQTRQALKQGAEQIGETTNRQVRLAQTIEKLVPKKAEQEALYTIGQGEHTALAALRRNLPQQFEKFVQEHFKGSLSVEGANLAANIAEGKAPQVAARIDEALKIGREGIPGAVGRAAREAQYVGGGNLRAEQTGTSPLSIAIDTPALRRATKLAETLRLKADAAAGRLARVKSEAEFVDVPAVQEIGTGRVSHFTGEDVKLSGRLGREEARQRVLENAATRAERRVARLRETLPNTIQAAPARLRPVLRVNRAVTQLLTEHENALRGAGLHEAAGLLDQAANEIPTTLQTLQAAGVDPEHFIHVKIEDTGKGVSPTSPTLPKVRKPRSERQRRGNDFERTVRAQAQGEIDELRTGINVQTAQRIAKMPWAKKAGGLGEGLGTPTKAELEAQGLVPWDPKNPFEIAQTVTPDTTIIPKGIFESFRTYNVPKNWEKVAGIVYDPLTKAFKVTVLPLSISWQVGNVVGNFLMATIGGGVNPVTLARNIGRTIAEYKRTGQFAGPERLFSSGATHESLDFLAGGLNRGNKFTRVAGAPIRLSYKANQFIDDISRSAVYLAKKGKGYSDELALRQALRAMGDFTNLSPFERRVVRRIIPFYSWQKHMAKLALTLPVEHPLRTAWTLNLTNQFDNGEDWMDLLPYYLRSAVPLGGGSFLAASNLFPFASPFGLASSLRQNLAPQLKLLLANVPGSPGEGIDPLSGRPYSRPPGTSKLDEYGREVPTAPSLLQQLRGIPPQLRLLDQLTGRGNVARYSTGEEVKVTDPQTGKKVPIKTEVDKLQAVLKFFGLPVKSRSELENMVLTRLEGQKNAELKKLPPTEKKSANGVRW